MLWLLLLLQVWASCLWLGHSEVVKSFKSCPQFFYQGTPPSNALQPEKPAWICQNYNNSYYFATLYNTEKRIPVYSAYIYEPGPGSKTHWMVEPQLMGPTYPKKMETEATLIGQYNVTSEIIGQNQSINSDYKGLSGLNRGHLNPAGHHNNNSSRNATFTLTNIVPQNSALNNGNWSNYEQKTMAKKNQDCINTYVITGAVPGNTYISKGRVNVPSHIWSSACCQTNNGTKAWAAIARNNQNKITILTLGQLEGNLTQLYGKGNVSLFPSICPR